jgi:hypothetical protein
MTPPIDIEKKRPRASICRSKETPFVKQKRSTK